MGHENDYHGHPKYDVIFGMLVVLMLLSVGADMLDAGVWGKVLIFALSTAKAYLVIANFMHLKYEPKMVDLFPYLSIALMLVFFFGVAPDTIVIPNVIAE